MVIANAWTAPVAVYATHDKRYGYLEVHESEADAQREVAREPALIELVVYELRTTQARAK